MVKRLLDGRTFMPMAQSGQTVLHTTSTVSMASLTLHLLVSGQGGTFNVADPVALTTARIAQTLAALMEKPLQIIEAPHAMNPIGHKPWSVDNPVRLSHSAALATGRQGPPAYADALPP